MSEHSGQIEQLPWFDANAPIPVRAIAGDVTLTEPSYKGRGGYTDDTSSDLIVSTRSALAASQDPATVPLGSGNTTIRCKQSVYQALSAACWHVGLLTDAKAQKAVVSAIKLYLTNQPFVAFAGTWRNPFSSITIGAYGSGEAHYDLPITDCPTDGARRGPLSRRPRASSSRSRTATGVATVTVVSSNTIVSAAEGQVLKDQATGALAWIQARATGL